MQAKDIPDNVVLIYLNGMTCLGCAKGWYDGYAPGNKTWPCHKCGYQAPAQMSREDFRKAVAERDARLGLPTS